jgi:hypothetical protein
MLGVLSSKTREDRTMQPPQINEACHSQGVPIVYSPNSNCNSAVESDSDRFSLTGETNTHLICMLPDYRSTLTWRPVNGIVAYPASCGHVKANEFLSELVDERAPAKLPGRTAVH